MAAGVAKAQPKARAKKGQQLVAIRHNGSLPGPAAAANLALIILSKASKNTWAELVVDPASYAHLRVSDTQRQLLIEFGEVLPFLARHPMQSVYACPECGRWACIDKTPVPARCSLTLGCPGRPARASSQQPKLEPAGVVEPGQIAAPMLGASDVLEPRT